MGPNGAGKTTLLNLIAGDLRPDRGTISLDGSRRHPAARARPVLVAGSDARRRSRGRSRVSRCSRTCSSAARSARRDGCSATADAAAVDALETTGMADKANVVAGTLTLLQRKRLELARALATQPSVLLLDEIAGGLTEAEILELVDADRGHPCDRRGDRVDRAHRPRAAPRGRSHDGDEHRPQAHRGRSPRGDVLRRGPRGVPRRGVRRGRAVSPTALLDIEALDVSYGDFQALFGVDLHVAAAETVSIIGANGAGKSTLLKTIVGLVPIGSGTITYAGTSLASLSAPRRVEQGISLVPEGRRIFPSLTVEENLAVGVVLEATGARGTRQRVVAAFPLLGPLLEAQQRGALGRRAAGARHRPRAHVEPRPAPARRGVARLGADRREAGVPSDPGDQGARHDGAARRAGREPGARGRRSLLLPARRAGVARRAAQRTSPRSRSPRATSASIGAHGKPSSADDLGQRDRAGHLARRPVRALRHRPVAGVRRDAVREPRPRRPRDPRGVRDAVAVEHDEHQPAVRARRSSSRSRSGPATCCNG